MSNFPTLNISAGQTIALSRPLINTYLSDAKTAMDAHVAGSADQHAAENITYFGEVSGASHVKSAVDSISIRIDAFVADTSGSTVEVVDARESTVKAVSYTVLDNRFEAIEGQGTGYQYEGKNFVINNSYRYITTAFSTYKGQLHCHTTNSDGVDTPASLVAAYRDAGYNFITITDHDVITANPAVTGNITWLGTSVEETQERHIVAYVITAQTTATNTQEIFNYHRANGKMTSLAHPNWNSDGANTSKTISQNEILKLYDFNFTEVFNALTATSGETQWDQMLSSGRKIFATAVDDCHSITASSSFNAAWVVVNATANESALILDSLRKGNFYASTGNDISVSISGKIITAGSAGNSNFSFIGRDGIILQTANATVSTTYTILGDERYIRIKSVKISDFTIAWSQPIFIEALRDEEKPISDAMRLYPNKNLIDNGNLDIWQKGVTFTNPTAQTATADQWIQAASADGGTLPNIVHSKQVLTSGEIFGSLNFYRVNVDGAGSSLGASSYAQLKLPIEDGTKCLCGLGKKVTLSFYARSDISGKRLATEFTQVYGFSGGSTAENIPGSLIELTNYWKKYTITINTNTLAGKTFASTTYMNYFKVVFWYAWGTTYLSRVGSGTAETFVGAGNIDIAHVKLEAGDIETEFIPKDINEELKRAYRYQMIPASSIFARMVSYASSQMTFLIPTPATMGAWIPLSLSGTLNSDIVIYNMSGSAQTSFSAYSTVILPGSVLLTLSKTGHGLTDGYVEIKNTSGFYSYLI